MGSNKKAKEALIELYGAECFIERLHLRDTSGLKYTGSKQYKRMKTLTYHHIKMKSKGGKATVRNGALLSAENHAWFHQQSNSEQERMNEMFQELKQKIDNADECEIVITEDVPQIADVRVITFNPKELEYNRAKEKAKTKKLVDDYYKGEER